VTCPPNKTKYSLQTGGQRGVTPITGLIFLSLHDYYISRDLVEC
jgi:hypothetical protein